MSLDGGKRGAIPGYPVLSKASSRAGHGGLPLLHRPPLTRPLTGPWPKAYLWEFAMTLRTEINVTPLIDIVLVLLIIFIVMVPALIKVQAVVVPRMMPGGTPSEVLVVRLDAEGRLFLQQKEIALGQLAEQLRDPLLLQPLNLRKVFFKLDGELPQQRAIAVLDQIRRASEMAKGRSRDAFRGQDGGDTKVVVSLLKPA